MVVESRAPRKKVLFESRREREFYRYYEAIRALSKSGPASVDLSDADAVKSHKPSSSPDRALTGALRLATRRAMLFFFDSSYAYILAEATRTLSLEDDSVDEIEDQLWMGASVIPRGYSVCEHTVNLPLHIINDLREDVRFCDRPFVLDGPKARFYAGVPITTPKGVNIGAYCVLDDKPREGGLDEKGKSFLRDMAATVMTHLEMSRATAEHQRGNQMVRSLSAFVEGTSGLRESNDAKEAVKKRHLSSTQPREGSLQLTPPSANGTESLASKSLPGSDEQYPLRPQPGNASPMLGTPVSAASSLLSSVPSPTSHSTILPQTAEPEDLRQTNVETNILTTFHRAAKLINAAVDSGNAIFLDASVGAYGDLLAGGDHYDSSAPSHDSVTSGTDTTNSTPRRHNNTNVPEDKTQSRRCHMLGSAHSHGSDQSFSRDTGSHGAQSTGVSERFLRRMLRKYPYGKIWNFNEDGYASSDDESSEGHESSKQSDATLESVLQGSKGEKALRRKRRKRAKVEDGREIQRIFPGVRSLALVGMWDHVRGRWFAACAILSYSPLRIFSYDSEVNFLAAFCDVVMAEIHRLEARISEKAKVDFVSSVSHELRSPLHGILGSAECLGDQSLDSFSEKLLSQIEICGRTLLDIVDHLLDFSKVNHYSQARADRRDSQGNPKRANSTVGRAANMTGTMSLDADVSLDVTTEEVVESAVYAFCCSRDKQTILDRKVAVVLDIDRSIEHNWQCRIAVGGWSRVCINLVSNALKYTSEGYIRVSLGLSAPQIRKRRLNAVLSVSDTGRGMSKEFLENYLFRPFSQEDSMVEGTGLGLSLVDKIVKALGGKIEVQSKQGVGTTVTVTVPLDRRTGSQDVRAERGLDSGQFHGLSLGIFEHEEPSNGPPAEDRTVDKRAGTLLHSSFRKTSIELGLQALSMAPSNPTTADLYLVTEQDLTSLLASLASNGSPSSGNEASFVVLERPLVVVCDNAMSERQLRTLFSSKPPSQHLELVSQPLGPERLSQAIRACLGLSAPPRSSMSLGAAVRGSSLQQSVEQRSASASIASSVSLPVRAIPRPTLQETLSSDGTSPTSMFNNPFETSIPHINGVLGEFEPGEARKSPPLFKQTPSSAYLEAGREGNVPTSQELRTKDLAESKAGLSLLLVDDNPINLQILETYATKNKHHKLSARDGLQAVEIYKAACLGLPVSTHLSPSNGNTIVTQQKPKVVLMDINMPVLNGNDATRRIRQFEQREGLAPTTIIALTGLGSAEAQQEAYNSGVDLFLTKPVRLKELTKILAGLQDGKNM